jgi:hypothetical protein
VKILWLSHLIPYPPKGGVLQRSYNLIRELAKYHELDLLAFNQRGLIGNLFPTVEQGIAEADVALGQICKRHRLSQRPTISTGLHPTNLAMPSGTGLAISITISFISIPSALHHF